jgi:hypothetical protein
MPVLLALRSFPVLRSWFLRSFPVLRSFSEVGSEVGSIIN